MSPRHVFPLASLALWTLAACVDGHVPEVDQAGAERLLSSPRGAVVIDLREGQAAGRDIGGSISGALRVGLDELDGYLSRADLARDTPLLIVCDRGVLSQAGGTLALGRGYRQVFSLRGGMDAWKGTVGAPAEPIPAQLRRPPILQATWLEQLLTVVFGIGIKATYMTLSLVAAAILWRSREKGLVLIRQAMLAFFFGEGMCAVNFLFASGESDAIELFHGLGMVGMGMLLPWGLMRLADERVLRYEDPTAACVVQRLCGRCWKRDPVGCGVQRLFLLLAPVVGLTALLPLGATLTPVKVEVPVFGDTFIDQVSLPLQIVEFRLYPILACALLFVSFLLLLGGRRAFAWSQPFFFAGFGLVTFTLMRFFLLTAFRDRIVWADAWEEATEFVAIAFVLWFLWVFRSQLGVLQFLGRQRSAGGQDAPRPG
ncbi:MAG: hypothetical protein HY901_10660 [Deltaproteobacteria bacterium]|nr:hypothetical protein [Deltaproteobacteria bacterium]